MENGLYPEIEQLIFDGVYNATAGSEVLLVSECDDVLSYIESKGYEIRKVEIDGK